MRIKNIIIVTTILTATTAGLVLAEPWTNPTTTAPGENADSPINTSVSNQAKQGGLGLGALSVSNNASVLGNLGVGTTGPAERLDVNGNIEAGSMFLSPGKINLIKPTVGLMPWQSGMYFRTLKTAPREAGIGYFRSTGGGAKRIFLTFGSNPWDSATGVQILQNGNVGIGTVDPSQKLDVKGHIEVDGGYISLIKPVTTSAWARGLLFRSTETGAYEAGVGYFGQAASLKSMFLGFGGNPWKSTKGIQILPNGDVGIGTVAPSQKLDVAGSARFINSSPTIRLTDTDHNDFMLHTNNSRLYFMHDANNNGSYDDGDNNRIVIDGSSGDAKLGVGISSPQAKLHVNGSVRATQYCNTAGTGCIDPASGGGQLEKVTEGGHTGWRIKGRDPANYADIGQDAVDLSYSGWLTSAHGASGDYSFAAGKNTWAKGESSIAIGQNTVANGLNSVAIGLSAIASGNNAISIGRGDASGDYSYSFGTGFASGKSSFALGISAFASGIDSIAMGRNSSASGPGSVAISEKSKASGKYSVAIGFDTNASGKNSLATGLRVVAPSANSTAMGLYNTNETSPEPTTFSQNNKRLFVLGNGTSTSKSDAFTILRNGRVGIDVDNFENVSGPEKLYVNGDIKLTSGTLYLRNNTQYLHGDNNSALHYRSNHSSYSQMLFRDKENTVYGRVYGADNGQHFGLLDADGNWSYRATKDNHTAFVINNSEKMRILANGNVGIGTTSPAYKLHVNGVAYASSWNTPSDLRYKKDIKTLPYISNTIMKLNPVTYHWNQKGQQNGGNTQKHTGFIAQELEKQIPSVVKTDKKGYKSVNYNELVPYLTKAIQEQQTTINKQQEQINELKKQNKLIMDKFKKMNE